MKRKYRLKELVVENIEAYFNTPYANECPTYKVFLVQMRVCGIWITIRSYDDPCEWLMEQQAKLLLETLNR